MTKKIPKTPSNVINKMAGLYDGKELRKEAVRPGATDTWNLPSRFGNEIRYPDGKSETIQHGNKK